MPPQPDEDTYFILIREGWGWAVHDITGVFEHSVEKMHHPRHCAYFWRRATAQHIANQLHFAYHRGLADGRREY